MDVKLKKEKKLTPEVTGLSQTEKVELKSK